MIKIWEISFLFSTPPLKIKNLFILPVLWPYHPKVTVGILTPYGNKWMKERHFTHSSVTAPCIILDHGFLSLMGTILIE